MTPATATPSWSTTLKTTAGQLSANIMVGPNGLLMVKNAKGTWDRVLDAKLSVRGLEGWVDG